jgi:prepilin-type N-terminal cleavage/methylation domain-containing protein
MIFFRFYLYRKTAGSIKYVKSRAGFSLLEVLVILAIIGIMSTIALPAYFSGQPYRRLKSASRDIYGAMQQARLLAVKNNQPVRVCFNSGANLYSLDDDGDTASCNTLSKQVDLQERYHDVRFITGTAPDLDTQNERDRIGAASNTTTASITFTATGTATFDSNNNAVYIENINNPLEVFAVAGMDSGAIKISWYDGTNWK